MAYDSVTEGIRRSHQNSNSTVAIAATATPAINVDSTGWAHITGLAVNVTSFTTGLTGTPIDGQPLTIRLVDNGVSRTLAWGASFEAVGAALPTATTAGKRHTLGFRYDSTTAKFGLVSAVVEA